MGNLMNDRRIAELARAGMIEPFVDRQVKTREVIMPGGVRITSGLPGNQKVVSWGLGSFGVDLRIGPVLKVFTPTYCGIVDVKNFDPKSFTEVDGSDVGFVMIPPNSFAIGVAVERLRLPRNVTAIVLGKSTLARAGIIVCCTPGEAGWEGYLTIEISNTTPLPAKIYVNEGVCQCLFFESDEDCLVSYADRDNGAGGKYQGQSAVPTPPRV